MNETTFLWKLLCMAMEIFSIDFFAHNIIIAMVFESVSKNSIIWIFFVFFDGLWNLFHI